MSVVNLKAAKAFCPHCQFQAFQIDASEERAVEVVRMAMFRHMGEEHGLCADGGGPDQCDNSSSGGRCDVCGLVKP